MSSKSFFLHFSAAIKLHFKASLGDNSRLLWTKYSLGSRRTWNNTDLRTHKNKEIRTNSCSRDRKQSFHDNTKNMRWHFPRNLPTLSKQTGHNRGK